MLKFNIGLVSTHIGISFMKMTCHSNFGEISRIWVKKIMEILIVYIYSYKCVIMYNLGKHKIIKFLDALLDIIDICSSSLLL